MNVPRAWAKASAECATPDHRTLPVSVWGWGESEPEARREASSRLARVLERIRRGEPFPDRYGYGTRPLREEILRAFDDGSGEPAGVVTRNKYGAEVLATATLLFLDIDVSPPTLGRRLVGMLRGRRDAASDASLAGVRDVLGSSSKATFRIYRTAAGFRAIAVDREFDPAGRDAQDLMRMTGTDPAYSRLCLLQKSFRARLTPKPWRCRCPRPPGEHPRAGDVSQRFAAWLREYDRVSAGYATCRYLETVGTGRPRADAVRLLELHDRTTRANDDLPLA